MHRSSCRAGEYKTRRRAVRVHGSSCRAGEYKTIGGGLQESSCVYKTRRRAVQSSCKAGEL